jgi:NodT family efflux transporter outer membrane factor (OMF) lipoprotein
VTRARSWSGAAMALVALAGCKAVGPDFQPPAPPKTSGYLMKGDAPSSLATMSPDAHSSGAWWKSFGSPDLDRVMDEALAGNQNLAAADASLARVRELAIAAHGAQLPQLDANASIQEERINIAAFGFQGFPNPTLGLYSVGATVSYDPDVFGGIRRSVEADRARVENQARQADAAYLTLTGQTAMAAIHIATVRASLAQAESSVADDKDLLAMTLRAVEAGGQASAAADKVRAQLAQDEAQLPLIRLELAQARHALAELVGEAPADWTAPEFDLAGFSLPSEIPVSLPSGLVRRRPDILAAEANLHVATAQVGVADAALYPDFRLTANLAQTAIPPASLLSYAVSGWSVGAGVTQPLFHGGTLKAEKRAAQDQLRVALAQYQVTLTAAFTQVSDVLQAIEHDQAEIVALTQAEEADAKALQNDEIAFRLGGGTLLPVIDDKRELERARQALVIAQGRRLADVAQLYVATAADWGHPKS